MNGLAVDLHRYLRDARANLLRKLDGLSEYDIRRPLVPTGTNLLGLVKHMAGIEVGYLGESVGRPAPFAIPWNDDGSVWDSADMWATAEESRAYLVDLHQRACAHSDESITRFPLDAAAEVRWWPEERRHTTFGHLLVRVTAETAQHAGQADIIRELIDGQPGKDHADMGDDAWWQAYVGKIQHAADRFREG